MRAGGANVRCVMEMQVSGLWLLRESEVTGRLHACVVCALLSLGLVFVNE